MSAACLVCDHGGLFQFCPEIQGQCLAALLVSPLFMLLQKVKWSITRLFMFADVKILPLEAFCLCELFIYEKALEKLLDN